MEQPPAWVDDCGLAVGVDPAWVDDCRVAVGGGPAWVNDYVNPAWVDDCCIAVRVGLAWVVDCGVAVGVGVKPCDVRLSLMLGGVDVEGLGWLLDAGVVVGWLLMAWFIVVSFTPTFATLNDKSTPT